MDELQKIKKDDYISISKTTLLKLQSAVDPGSVIVYIVLLGHYNQHLNFCQISVRQLAKEAKIANSTALIKLQKLQEANLIKKVNIPKGNEVAYGAAYEILSIE